MNLKGLLEVLEILVWGIMLIIGSAVLFTILCIFDIGIL